ncbi:MAG: hypothetical protein J6A21_02375 [Lentisphaeria bacterium]|nr:hypothetical protein [Lentisphaeria bacterium]
MTKRHAPVRQLLFDFHTMPGNPEIGRDFDFEKIGEYFRSCQVDSVLFPFRCNQGFAYFPTETGIPYPGLKFDLVGKMIETCRKLGIQCQIYTNAVVCVEAGQRHPEWLKRTPDFSAHDNTLCSNADGFTQELCAMLREVTKKYSPDGLFLDFGYDPPCICGNCLRLMEKEGIDWKNDPEAHLNFAIRSSMRKYHAMCEAALEHDPEMLLCINGIPYEEKTDHSSHFEFECLPTSTWGYHQLPVFSRYLRNIGKPVTNMTGRFHGGWGDFGGLRPRASLEYDVFYGLGNGMGTTIGDHFHPRGDMYPAVMDLVSGTMRKLKAVEEWTNHAVAETEIAVIAPKGVLDGVQGTRNAVTGAARMLTELKQQFDILSDLLPFRREYKLLILPDETRMTPALKERIQNHLEKGGKIISSMYSGLDVRSDGKFVPGMEAPEVPHYTENQNASQPPEFASEVQEVLPADKNDRFVFPQWGVSYAGLSPWDPLFITSKKIASFPDMPITEIARSSLVEPEGDTEVLAEYTLPFFNRQSRAVRHFQYLPPRDNSGKAAMTISKQVAHIAFPVFSAYFDSARLQYRTMVAEALQRFLPDPIVKAPNALSFVKIFVTSQQEKGRMILHILSNFPEKRTPRLEVVEDDIPVSGMLLKWKTGGKVKKLYTVPEKREIPFAGEGEYISFTVPDFAGHTMIVAEK